jgi:hypothetical protein
MRYLKMSSALLTALAVGLVGCEPAEPMVDPVDPVPVVDPVTVDSTTTTTDPAWTDAPATDEVDAVIVTPAPESGFGTAAPEPGTAVPAPAPGANTESAPADEPLLQPDDAIEETPAP